MYSPVESPLVWWVVPCSESLPSENSLDNLLSSCPSTTPSIYNTYYVSNNNTIVNLPENATIELRPIPANQQLEKDSMKNSSIHVPNNIIEDDIDDIEKGVDSMKEYSQLPPKDLCHKFFNTLSDSKKLCIVIPFVLLILLQVCDSHKALCFRLFWRYGLSVEVVRHPYWSRMRLCLVWVLPNAMKQ